MDSPCVTPSTYSCRGAFEISMYKSHTQVIYMASLMKHTLSAVGFAVGCLQEEMSCQIVGKASKQALHTGHHLHDLSAYIPKPFGNFTHFLENRILWRLSRFCFDIEHPENQPRSKTHPQPRPLSKTRSPSQLLNVGKYFESSYKTKHPLRRLTQ
jgi:hypothetical protein